MNNETKQPDNARGAKIEALLEGAIDLHCHSGPSVMPRDIDHIEALRQASEVKMKAILIKDHYYSATPVTELLNDHFGQFGVKALSGVPLNNSVGGFNIFAVDHGLKLGACLVWMPTFSAANHINEHRKDADHEPEFGLSTWTIPRKINEVCPTCDASISRLLIRGRSSFFCPCCQLAY